MGFFQRSKRQIFSGMNQSLKDSQIDQYDQTEISVSD
jgi:hypothetical protein